mmetsp:Transcript_70135/g.159191  ORF Transcript_70135/g.159191 Transcript_70135/m.159191 type:complete len:247 (-) Transcript_70135:1012-1752(-)
MACWTATCASLASLMVCSLAALDARRSLVAEAMASPSSWTPFARSAKSWVSCMISAVRSSICEERELTSAVFASRVTLLVLSSVSHQPLCSTSAVPSSISCEIRSLMSFFTLVKGFEATCTAKAERAVLPALEAASRSTVMAFSCRALAAAAASVAAAPLDTAELLPCACPAVMADSWRKTGGISSSLSSLPSPIRLRCFSATSFHCPELLSTRWFAALSMLETLFCSRSRALPRASSSSFLNSER